MLTVIVTAELEVDYNTWHDKYLTHKMVRTEAGIEDVFVGKDIEANRFVSILRVPSVEVLQGFMEANAEFMSSVGHKVETTQVTIAE